MTSSINIPDEYYSGYQSNDKSGRNGWGNEEWRYETTNINGKVYTKKVLNPYVIEKNAICLASVCIIIAIASVPALLTLPAFISGWMIFGYILISQTGPIDDPISHTILGCAIGFIVFYIAACFCSCAGCVLTCHGTSKVCAKL